MQVKIMNVSGYNSPINIASKEVIIPEVPVIVNDHSIGSMIRRMDLSTTPLQTSEKTAYESRERLETKYLNPAKGLTLRKRFE